MSGDALAINSRVQGLSADQLLERYHELVDRRLTGQMHWAESLELDQIEARLNLQDEADTGRQAVLRDDWNRERDKLVASIESLLPASRQPPDRLCPNFLAESLRRV